MKERNAASLLAKVLGLKDIDGVPDYFSGLKLLSDYKYDSYQQFGPGRKFIENLALWLERLDEEDRSAAIKLVNERLVYFSDAEMSHLVSTAYPDLIIKECIRLVSEELDIPSYKVGKIGRARRFKELRLKSLYLGLSDGARTNELRRSSSGQIGNEQIWQAYELSVEKAKDMAKDLDEQLNKEGIKRRDPRFNIIWLLDDFSGSGNTYIRYDHKNGEYKGKLKKVFERLYRGDLIDTSHCEVFLLLYVATKQAVDHIEYWAGRFTSENNYKPIQIKVICPIGSSYSLNNEEDAELLGFLEKEKYYDQSASDAHTQVGGTDNVRMGFAGCALPVVLSHNTPNNSIYLLWGPEDNSVFGLFPRVSRHREF